MKRIILLLIFIVSASYVPAQFNGYDFSISSGLVYTTSAEIFLNPNSVDPIIRNKSFELQDILNPALDFRLRLSEPILIGLSVEFMKSSQTGRNLTVYEGNNEIRLETEDGFVLIPIEATVYYQMPFSTHDFKFLMGGGVGMFIGEFKRNFGDTDVSTLQRQSAFGIHVSISMEYVPLERVGLRFEMKFRDPEFKTKNRYNKTKVNYNGSEITILRDTFDTKVNVNGITFLLGAAIYF